MSKFFKALQQAEQERALRSQPERVRDRLEQSGAGAERPSLRTGDVRAGEGASGETTERRPLATTVHSIEGVEEHLVSLLRPSSFEAEQYRTLSNLVERLHETGSVTVVGIASPSGGDGKTVAAINLAAALAQDRRSRVLLLEADLRQPMVAKYLGFPDQGRGLAQVIAHPELALTHAVTTLPGVNLDVLTAGHPSATPYEALRSSRAAELFQEARRAYDHVVVDTPSLGTAPEGRVIEKLVDGFFVVVRAHRTLRNQLDEALRLTDTAKVLGLVFNGDDRLVPGSDRYSRYRHRDQSRNGHGGHGQRT
jgi:protein-tyrosine kinase